ncbi:MAG TPA: twin-arginine translocase TatA/TatE family subunit [Pirellulaceae bacterium]|nr:twin-arginine translocase TatA/TatE family subunit [Pirellulaceae bacterium]
MFPGGIGTGEILVILVLAVILFGRNLPQVARSLGNSYQQFRKGLSEVQRSINVDDSPGYRGPTSTPRLPTYQDELDHEGPPAPRFEIPPSDNGSADSGASHP